MNRRKYFRVQKIKHQSFNATTNSCKKNNVFSNVGVSVSVSDDFFVLNRKSNTVKAICFVLFSSHTNNKIECLFFDFDPKFQDPRTCQQDLFFYANIFIFILFFIFLNHSLSYSLTHSLTN